MDNIETRLSSIRARLPLGVRLVAVSKMHPHEMVEEAYHAGQRIFGENKVQELCQKHDLLHNYADIRWHLIGHLQTNKVKYITSFIDMIHSVDSLKLLKEIDKHAAADGRVINCLLEFRISDEATKFGMSYDGARELLLSPDFCRLANVKVCGVMGMAAFTDDKQVITAQFRQLVGIFDKLKTEFFANDPAFCEKSFGMTNDWQIAVCEGATMVRIGSAIFGHRDYNVNS